MDQFILVNGDGRMAMEDNVASIPNRLIRGGWRCFAIAVNDDGIPRIGDEVTIGEGRDIAAIKEHDVKVGDEVIGTGQTKG